jgi:hypothetical protein
MTTPETPAATIRRAAAELREHPERFLHRAAALAIADEMDSEAHNIERRLPDGSGAAAHWLRIARACLNEPDPDEVAELARAIMAAAGWHSANGPSASDVARAALRWMREQGTGS